MKIDRQEIYDKYSGYCAYCGKKIEYKDMQIDHINPKFKGGVDDIENLNPSCRACNFYKSVMTLDSFREQIDKLPERLNKHFIYCLAKNFGLINETNNKVVFYFETLIND